MDPRWSTYTCLKIIYNENSKDLYVFPSRRYQTNEVKEDDFGCTCSTYQREYNVFGVSIKGPEKTLTKSRSICVNVIKMDLKEI